MSKALLRSRDLFAVQRVCFETDIIQGLAGIPQWGLRLPRQHWRQIQSRKWMCQITQCHPLGEICRCVCMCVGVCVRTCAQILTILFLPWWTCCYLYFFSPSSSPSSLSPCVSFVFAPLFPLLLCSFFCFCFFYPPSHKMQSEQLYLCLTQTWLAFLLLLLCVCHNL